MWIKPGYTPDGQAKPKSRTVPTETGDRLATFPRGADAELRVTLAEFEGNPYIGLRVWERAEGGGKLVPVRGKGCSIRMGEAGRLAEVLASVAAGTKSAGPANRRDGTPLIDSTPTPTPRRTSTGRGEWTPTGDLPPREDAPFSEFDDENQG